MDTLIIVDMLEDFVNPKGALYVPKAETIVNKINKLILQFHDKLVIFANDAHTSNDPEFKDFPPHAIKGTNGAKIFGGISMPIAYVVIDKVTFDPFTNLNLHSLLKDCSKICVCGVVTEICVKATTLSALGKNYDVVVVSDAIMRLNKKNEQLAIKLMKERGAEFTTLANLKI